MDAGAGWGMFALQAASMVAQGISTSMKIEEGISDYAEDISNTGARIGETAREALRRVAQTRTEGGRVLQKTKVEGVANLQEMGKEAAYESGIAQVQGQMTASSATAKLGSSGVRAAGSPLMAAQQAANLARGEAAEKTRRGNAGIAFGGLRLGGGLADINAQKGIDIANTTAQASLVTAEYQRQKAASERKKAYLKENKAAMVLLSAAGGAPALAESFFEAGQGSGWW